MPTPIATDLGRDKDPRSLPTDREDRVFATTVGVRLSDILNLRVGCWRPAVYLGSRPTAEG